MHQPESGAYHAACRPSRPPKRPRRHDTGGCYLRDCALVSGAAAEGTPRARLRPVPRVRRRRFVLRTAVCAAPPRTRCGGARRTTVYSSQDGSRSSTTWPPYGQRAPIPVAAGSPGLAHGASCTWPTAPLPLATGIGGTLSRPSGETGRVPAARDLLPRRSTPPAESRSPRPSGSGRARCRCSAPDAVGRRRRRHRRLRAVPAATRRPGGHRRRHIGPVSEGRSAG